MQQNTDLTIEQRIARHERAREIIADYEHQHEFVLPKPWVDAIGTFLLRGLSDQSLHLIFETLMQVEYEAGRLADRHAPPAPID
jgi:hypothetical protein